MQPTLGSGGGPVLSIPHFLVDALETLAGDSGDGFPEGKDNRHSYGTADRAGCAVCN